MPQIQLGEYMPDLPVVGLGPNLIRADNSIATLGGYKPFRQLVTLSAGSLNAYCRGASSGRRRNDGTSYTCAGTSTKLYVTSTAGTLTDRTGSLTTLGTTSGWTFAQHTDKSSGTARLIAASIENALQTHTLSGTGNFADLSADAPKAKCVATIGDFLFAGNIVGRGANSGIGTAHDSVQWSAIDNPTSWPAFGTDAAKAVQSDYQPLSGFGGDVQAIVGGREYGIVFQERAVTRVDYQGGSVFFSFTPLDRRRGAFIPGSVIQVGDLIYFYTEEGFYACNGAQCVAIGDGRVDRTFLADLDDGYLHRVSVSFDPREQIVVWSYPGAGNSGGTPNRALVYNYTQNRWSGPVEMTIECLVRTTQVGPNVDTPISADIDGSPFDVDATTSGGVRPSLGAFNTSHTLGSFTGAPLSMRLQTGDFEITPGKTSFVRSVRPVFTGTGGTCAVAVSGRNTPGASAGADHWALTNDSQGNAGQRSRARYHRLSLYTLTDCGTVSGVDAEVQPMGAR